MSPVLSLPEVSKQMSRPKMSGNDYRGYKIYDGEKVDSAGTIVGWRHCTHRFCGGLELKVKWPNTENAALPEWICTQKLIRMTDGNFTRKPGV